MEFIADLHIHSKYSRATAKNLDFENLYYAAQIKGVSLVGTGDFTYPAWIDEIESKLDPAEPGLFTLKPEIAKEIDKTIPENCRNQVRFILQTEISNIYKKADRVRKNHNLIYLPDIASVKQFNAKLDVIGNIKSDGRPILGLDAADLLQIMLETNDKGFFVPAHIWTPWFSLFGSKSGYDSMEECFGSLTKHIFAVETGLSSDPPMNWRIEDLDDIRLISNSDAHSPGYLGRNANLFDTEFSFAHIREALEKNDLKKFNGTLDMYPHQGKYHFDGHRKCNICLNPATTAEIDGICPECSRKVTYGVLNRVQELATRPEGYLPENRHGYKSIIPLTDILSEIFEVGPKTKKVAHYYNKAIESLGSELDILLKKSFEEIESANVPLLAEAVKKMRCGDIDIDPGYDGEFGKVNIFTDQEKEKLRGEKYFLFKLPKKKKSKKVKKNPKERVQESGKSNKVATIIKPQRKEKKSLLEGLNPEQKKAVESELPALVIQAGPGTGKTRTLTAKIAHLVSIKKVDPTTILALTFTNKAAKELETRIETYVAGPNRGVTATTFHAFCLKFLKNEISLNITIADDALRHTLINEAIPNKSTRGQRFKIDRLMSRCKQYLLTPEDNLDILEHEFIDEDLLEFKNIYKRYENLCKEWNVIDFEDLIFKTVIILKQDPKMLARVKDRYRYIFVDEYQDLNFCQYELVRLISDNNHIFVIGDPDQSIYGFRGSDNKYFKQFQTDFPGCEKIILTQNYRSTQTILDASFQMINKSEDNNGSDKIYSDLQGVRKLVVKETASESSEAVAIAKIIEKQIGGTSFFSMDSGRADSNDAEGQIDSKEYSFSDFAILYRTRKQCEAFINIFEKEGIPYQTADRKNVYDKDGIKELISLIRILTDCASIIDFDIVFEYLGVKLNNKRRDVCLSKLKESRSGKKGVLELFIQEKNKPYMDKAFECFITLAQRLLVIQTQIHDIPPESAIDVIIKETELIERINQDDKAKQVLVKIQTIANGHPHLKGVLDELMLDQDVDTIAFNTEKVSLMTMHAAKGLEFPILFVTGCENGLIPYARDGVSVDDINEERRLFYVGMTRAMDILYLTYARKRSIYGNIQKRQRSPFIDDIEKKLTKLEKNISKMPATKKEKQMELF